MLQRSSIVIRILSSSITSKSDVMIHLIDVRIGQIRTLANQSKLIHDPTYPLRALTVISSPPNPGDKPKPTPLAYATNSDKDDTSYPMINVCQGFLNRRSLADAITYGKGLNSPGNLQLSNYDNRAQTFFVSI